MKKVVKWNLQDVPDELELRGPRGECKRYVVRVSKKQLGIGLNAVDSENENLKPGTDFKKPRSE